MKAVHNCTLGACACPGGGGSVHRSIRGIAPGGGGVAVKFFAEVLSPVMMTPDPRPPPPLGHFWDYGGVCYFFPFFFFSSSGP